MKLNSKNNGSYIHTWLRKYHYTLEQTLEYMKGFDRSQENSDIAIFSHLPFLWLIFSQSRKIFFSGRPTKTAVLFLGGM